MRARLGKGTVARRQRGADPAGPVHRDTRADGVLGGADGDASRPDIDGEGIASVTVARHPEPAALAHRDELAGGNGADHFAARGVDQLCRVQAHALRQEAAPAASGVDETHVLAVGLLGGAQPELAGAGSHLGLGQLTHGEHQLPELVGAEHRQHVRLVLLGVRATSQTRAVGRR